MASEIRVNKIANRAGLSTVEYTDTGIIVSGIVTCTEISGLNALNIAGVSTFASPLDINGDIDVDGHTNLDNLSVAGVSTFSNVVNVGNNIQFTPSSGNISGTTAVFDDFVDVGSNIKLGNAGVVTATSYRGDGSQLTGIVAGLSTISGVVNVANDLDVDGHTNLDNVSIAGVTTMTGALFAEGNSIEIKGTMPYLALTDTNSNPDYSLFNLNGVFSIYDGTNSANRLTISSSGNVSIPLDLDVDGHTNLDNVSVAGVLTATSFSGDGSSLSNLPAGAPVGGASTNTVFFENAKEVAVNYQVTSTKNAMSAGPIAINAGIAVTVPSGCSWTIV